MAFNAFLIDRDGVLNPGHGGRVFPEVKTWLTRLVQKKIPFLIATNHSITPPEEAVMELRAQGVPIEKEQLHTPLNLLSDMFQARPPGRIYARGAPGFLSFLHGMGIELVNDSKADTVLLGFDRQMTYPALSTAITAVLDNGASLIAIHENHIFRDARGNVEPGLGCWVRAIEYATGTKATIVGKPSQTYFAAALEKLGARPADTVMISDDPVGDLAGAKDAGLYTVFVLSGKYQDPTILQSSAVRHPPDRVLKSIAELGL